MNKAKRRPDTPRLSLKGRIENTDIRLLFYAMFNRCYVPSHDSYAYYGAKGVAICRQWLDNPGLFEEWALANGYVKGMTVDRIDSYKGYSPDNCRIVTKSENSKWQKKTHRITLNGITNSGRGWEEQLIVPAGQINQRVRKNGLEQTIRELEKEYFSAQDSSQYKR